MTDEDHLMGLLKKIATEQNFQTFDIQITPISSGGASYSSKLYCITIRGTGKDDLKLFAKASVLGEKLRGETPLKPFDTECLVYTELMKAYRRLEEKHAVSEEEKLRFPEFYGVDLTYLHEIIVLEDLISRGFGSPNRFESVDWQFATAAITELAKFHALSIAYQHDCPREFEETLQKLPSGMFKDDEHANQFFVGAAKTALATVREENKERLKSFLDGKNLTTICDLYHPLIRSMVVHMDYRPSNMLYRVRGDGTTEVIPVDYQTVQAGSPIIDLLYFIFTATDGQFRAKHYQQLVNHYHSELGVALARFGLDVEKIYSKKDFEFELKEKLHYGLLISVLFLPIVTVAEDQAPVVDEGLEMASFAVQTPGVQYADRINEAVDDFIAWGVL